MHRNAFPFVPGDAPSGETSPMAALYAAAPWLCALARVFDAADTPLYAVGGAVRNTLMGVPLSDIDVCGPARPEAVMALCEGTPVRAVARAAHFGTVELHYADDSGRHMAEYTTFRYDSYRGGHKPESVRFTTDMAVDATRRDFSVNALYCPLHENAPGDVADPTGGLAHLRAGVLYTVTPDPDRVLKDDGLRILRMARFQAELGLTPAPALLESAARHARLLEQIYPERLHDELRKLLLADERYPSLPRPGPATLCGLRTLAQIGAFALLFAPLPYDDAAARAVSAYREPTGVSPVAGRVALLFARADHAALGAALARLRFSNADREQALALHAAQARLLRDDLPLFDAVRAGVPAVAHAARALAALAEAEADGAPNISGPDSAVHITDAVNAARAIRPAYAPNVNDTRNEANMASAPSAACAVHLVAAPNTDSATQNTTSAIVTPSATSAANATPSADLASVASYATPAAIAAPNTTPATAMSNAASVIVAPSTVPATGTPSAARHAAALLARLQAPGLPLTLQQLAITGADVKPLCQGLPAKAIGEALAALWREAVEGACANTPEALLARARVLLGARR